MIEVRVDSAGLNRALGRLAAGTAHPARAMEIISEDMLDAVKQNFAAEGRPKWLGLKPSRRKGRGAGHKILQDTRQLANSIVAEHDSQSARVGTNKVYAAIHQFGGQAGRGRRVTIQARPFLLLTAADETRIEHSMSDYLAGVIA